MAEFSELEIKTILQVNSNELASMREQGDIEFEQREHSYFYLLPEKQVEIATQLNEQLIDWHVIRHKFTLANKPLAPKTLLALNKLVYRVLLPINENIGKPKVTYGFTSFKLKNFIQKNSSSGTAPSLDQHSAYEVNSKGNQICSRGGAACDFYVEGVAASDIVRYIVNNLSFDRIYFYGNDRPVHVSFHLESLQHHLQVMGTSDSGRRYPASKAFGEDAKLLAEKL
ncbi:hypothetical protein [Alteromonas sp. BMJM2]|uniref:hypothetical protein n=1 Tax=Alteromonas sp. BMJM2 TaxID=2954241 RepID=UPI0022B37F75|nr:hypothetical protein [Alteromonas sp. BMJM2]